MEATARPLKVLVVDDNPQFVDYVSMQIESLDLVAGRQTQAITASDLASALTCLEHEDIGIILLDLGLSDSSGMDTLVAVADAAHAVPIVVITGSETDSVTEAAVLAGAQDLLVKGDFNGADLQRTIRINIARHRHYLELVAILVSEANESESTGSTRLQALNNEPQSVAGRSLGRVRFAESYPAGFDRAVETYSDLVINRLEERGFEVDYQVGVRAKDLATQLGRHRVSSRDVVEIHIASLTRLVKDKGRPRANALYRSGETMLTEVLGHLASHYRAQALGRAFIDTEARHQ